MSRGCGTRQKGGAYLTVAKGPDGVPMEYFIYDPPLKVDLNELGITPRGIHLIERDGVHHVFDVVGKEHYPNVADFIKEAKLMGISRRAELSDYSKLSQRSFLILIHQRAFIENHSQIWAELSDEERSGFACPKQIHRPHDESQMCAGLWWHDVEGMSDEQEVAPGRFKGTRNLPCGKSFEAYRSDSTCSEYEYAIFASFPLSRIEVVNDPDDQAHEQKLKKVSASGLEVCLVES